MPFDQRFDPADLGPRERRERLPGAESERRRDGRFLVGGGTFACPACDLPVDPAGGISVVEPVGCPYCDHVAPGRDFLTLTHAPRPARVRVTAALRPRSLSGLVEQGQRECPGDGGAAGEGHHEGTAAER